ncbi:MAG: DivIVA domain-containing protein [Hamadaea sp.]|nr:DivIVA domain-containing protein [Hamadaea sp.]
MTLLTPQDIRNVAFRKPAIGKRGYDELDVDTFLDAVEQTITALYDEIGRLRSGAAAPAYAAAPPPGPDGLQQELAQIRAALARIEAAVGRGPSGNPLF